MELYNYRKINNKVKKLKIVKPPNLKKRNFYRNSVLLKFFLQLKELIKFPLTLFYEYVFGFSNLIATFKLRNIYKGKKAIILGSGPSLNFISTKQLNLFKKSGNHIYALNYWNENTHHNNVVPNFLCFSDPNIFNRSKDNFFFKKKDNFLKKYLLKTKINLLVPIRLYKSLENEKINNKKISFVDTELRFWSSFTNPLLPRGYISSSFMKALSIALWFGYSKIYIIGFDNTYHRDIFCSEDNKIYNYEHHTNKKYNYLQDYSEIYEDIADLLNEISQIYYDIRKFKKYNQIINLDPYSTNTNFKKKSILKYKLNKL